MQYKFPDLASLCTIAPSASNPHYERACAESREWVNSFHLFPPKKRAYMTVGQFELLASYACPYADYRELRTVCDFLNFVFAIDEITDDLDQKGVLSVNQALTVAFSTPDGPRKWNDPVLIKMAVDLFDRIRATAGPNNLRRFLKNNDEYLRCVLEEAALRDAGDILDDLESYNKLRRGNAGLQPCLDLTEYALGIDLPDEVFEDPAFLKAYWAVVDIAGWTNDLYSYNAEQAKGHPGNNILSVVMKSKGMDLQAACDYVGDHIKALADDFVTAQAALPSWGPKVDADVTRYLAGAAHWVTGVIDWSFDSERYFGAQNKVIKETLTDTLRPRSNPEDHMFEERAHL